VSLPTLRRWLGIAGITLLGGALALAPILAFTGGMTLVSGAGLAGVACLIAMRWLPRAPEPDAPGDGQRPKGG
jgi:ABC-type transport system involved in cytochrome c biogenesis permease subunit